jgi:ribosomal protein S18 acetylase RimI-like enzyme
VTIQGNAGVAVEIRPIDGTAEVALARMLFARYADGLDVDLTYQGFEAECAGLPQPYVGPRGSLFLAWANTRPGRTADARVCGCVAVRPLTTDIAEMKRLFVDETTRGLGVGRLLAEAAIGFAASAGYDAIRLDTLPSMVGAQTLYRSLGFYDVAPYYDSPVTGTRFLERKLSDYRRAPENARD